MSREVETFVCVFPVYTVGGEEVNFLCRTPLLPLPPPGLQPVVPTAVRDRAVSPVSSGSRKRPRPVYLELVPSTETFISLPTSSLGNPIMRIPTIPVAGIRMPVLFPERGRTGFPFEMIRTTLGHQIRMRRAKVRSEGDHLPSPSPRKALKRAPTVNISLHLASSSRSSSSPSSMTRGSGLDMLNNAPMGVRHHGAAHGRL